MRRIVLVQLLLFAATALIVVPYGIYYIVGSSLGERMRVTALVDDALGVGEGTVVTYRGVRIGTVASVRIAPLDGGARIELDLDADSEVPADSYAKITQGTLAGMLNVDIFPRTDGGPYLTDGDTIDMPADEQTVQIGETLAQTAELLGSVEPGTIATVGAELGSAFEGLGPDLARLIGDVDRISAGLEADVGGIADLLTRSIDLTATMAANSTQFVDGMASARRLAESLHANEDRVSSMLATTPDAMRRADGVLAENEESFAAIVANLDSVAPIISDRSSALAAGLVAIPRGPFRRTGPDVRADPDRDHQRTQPVEQQKTCIARRDRLLVVRRGRGQRRDATRLARGGLRCHGIEGEVGVPRPPPVETGPHHHPVPGRGDPRNTGGT